MVIFPDSNDLSSIPVWFWEVSKKSKRSILTSCAVWYPERDLNPHNRNGHRILSPACLPFHHPGGIIFLYLNQHSPACRTLSRYGGNSTIRAELSSYISINIVLCVGPCPAMAGIPPSGRFLVVQIYNKFFLIKTI